MKRRDFLIGSTLASLGLPLAFEARSEARQIPPPLSAYARNPNVEDIAISPDGKNVAIITQKDGQRHVAFFHVDSQILKFYPTGENKVRSLFFASPDHLVIITSLVAKATFYAGGGKELSQAHIINIKTGKFDTLFSRKLKSNGIITGDLNTYQRNGSYYITASNVEHGVDFYSVLYEFDLDILKHQVYDEGTSDTENWVLDEHGNLIARSSFNRSKEIWSVEYREDGKWKKIYEFISKLDRPSLIGLGRDGKSVVLSYRSGPLDGRFVELNPEGELSSPLDTEGDYNRALFHPTTKRLCGFSTHDEWVTYDYFDPMLKKIDEGAKTYFKGLRYRFHDFTVDPRKNITYFEGDQNSGTYSLMDFSTGDEITIGENYPEIPPEWIVQKQKFTYLANDGLEITAYLSLPPKRGGKNLPLIVMPHGGPQSRDRLDFDWQVEVLTSRGYAVLQPNFRGSSGYGDTFVEAGYGQWGKKMQTDLSDGVRHLAKLGTIDPRRVAIMGASYGGYAALAGAAFDPDIYLCAISIAGLSDLKAMYEWERNETGSAKSTSVQYWKRFWGDVVLDDISPAKHVDAINIPILLIHGTHDTVVPINQSRRMNKAMKSAGKDVTFIEFDKEDHWQSLAPARLEMIEAVMAFLDKHNPAFI